MDYSGGGVQSNYYPSVWMSMNSTDKRIVKFLKKPEGHSFHLSSMWLNVRVCILILVQCYIHHSFRSGEA